MSCEGATVAMVIGQLHHAPIVETSPTGTSYALFELSVRKQLPAGGWVTTQVPCKVWGKAVALAQDLQPGQTVLVRGELSRLGTANERRLCVSGFELEVFVPAQPASTA